MNSHKSFRDVSNLIDAMQEDCERFQAQQIDQAALKTMVGMYRTVVQAHNAITAQARLYADLGAPAQKRQARRRLQKSAKASRAR